LTPEILVVNMNFVCCGLFFFFGLVNLDFETYYQTDNIMLFVSMVAYCVTCYFLWKAFFFFLSLLVTCFF